jgi:hypothetical protein
LLSDTAAADVSVCPGAGPAKSPQPATTTKPIDPLHARIADSSQVQLFKPRRQTDLEQNHQPIHQSFCHPSFWPCSMGLILLLLLLLWTSCQIHFDLSPGAPTLAGNFHFFAFRTYVYTASS